jgi:O-antigen/teichoic acid export membrane protein
MQQQAAHPAGRRTGVAMPPGPATGRPPPMTAPTDGPAARMLQGAVSLGSRVLRIDGVLLQHAAVLLAATVVGQLISFAVQVLVANRIAVEAYGVYSFAWTWVAFLAMLALFGSERLIIRYGSAYHAGRQPGRLLGLAGWTVRRALALAGLLAAGFVAVRLASAGPAPTPPAILAWSVVAILALVIAALAESLLRVLQALTLAALASRVIRPVLMGGLFLAAGLVAPPAGAATAMASNTLAVLLSGVIALLALRPLLPHEAAERPADERRRWRATAGAFGINAVALHLSVTLDMLLLGLFCADREVGIYSAVQRYAVVMGFATTAMITIVQPMLVPAAAAGDRAHLQRLVGGGARFVTLVSLAVGLPLLVFAEPLLAVFGAGFAEGADALRILVVGSLVCGLINLAGAVLGMAGHEGDATRVVVAGCGLTLVLLLVLIPSHGIIGAAVATTASRIAWNVALFAMAWHRLGVLALPIARPGIGRRSGDR